MMYSPSLAPVVRPTGPVVPPALSLMIDSFALSLRAARKSKKTLVVYLGAAHKLATWLAERGVTDLAHVNRTVLRLYMAWLLDEARKPDGKPYAPGYVNNQYRALQQFFKWWAGEEDRPNPMLGMKPPSVGTKVTPVLEDETLTVLIRGCEKGRDFVSRRDAAILRLFACTGVRLAELTNLEVDHVDLRTCTALVTGKGDIQRVVKFDMKAAQAIDRYLRVRATHKKAAHPRLWLGEKGKGPIADNGIRQMVERRGQAAGIHLHPHMFRHNFSHRWLDAGGAEGDLMELNGWSSAQMLVHYGRSARSARARRAYDRVNVMGDI
jgi:site-specific recombinase XerD